MRLAHVRCGTDLFPNLEASGLAGARLSWPDPLCQGPLRRGPRSQWRHLRADFLALSLGEDLARMEALLDAEDAALDALEADEICLWFEHDLYDQIILAHLVPRLADRARLSLVCLGAWPGVEPFVGLVQIPLSGLHQAFDARQRLGPEDVAAARLAWDALTSPDPAAVERVRHDPTLARFAFLPDALQRWLEEFPAIGDGLGRTERQVLQVLVDGPRSFTSLFADVRACETRPWLADTMLHGLLWRLALETMPLISIEDDDWLLTPVGREVLRGDADRVFLNGCDADHGGARLTGRNPGWRWNRERQRLDALP